LSALTMNGHMETKPTAGRPDAGFIFALIIVAYFLDVIDFSIVQVALPAIRAQFSVSLPDVQWVIGAYGITLAGFLLLAGRAGDLYGQKRLFIAGITLFTLSSFIGGFAPSFLILTAARAIQGIGAAMSTVTAFALFIELYPEGEARNRAMGVFIAVLSAGFAAGSVIGGILTVTLGWRSVLFVNVPLGIAAAILSQRFIPRQNGKTSAGRLDLPGAAAVTGGLITLVYSLTNAANDDFTLPHTVIPFVVSLMVLAGFLMIEARSKHPLMPLGFFRSGSVLMANLLSLMLASTVTGISFLVTVYFQQILHFSPLNAGLAQLPGALIFFFMGGWGASRFINAFGSRRVLVASTLCVAGGALLLTVISPTGSYAQALPGLLVWSLGASLGFPALNVAALSGIKSGEEGLASGILNTSFRVGSPLGLAMMLIVAGLVTAASGGHADSGSAAAVVAGFRAAFIAAATIGVMGLFVALRMPLGNPDGHTSPGQIVG
jgi:EmrB/QacA subfamily drug resistance transporter